MCQNAMYLRVYAYHSHTHIHLHHTRKHTRKHIRTDRRKYFLCKYARNTRIYAHSCIEHAQTRTHTWTGKQAVRAASAMRMCIHNPHLQELTHIHNTRSQTGTQAVRTAGCLRRTSKMLKFTSDTHNPTCIYNTHLHTHAQTQTVGAEQKRICAHTKHTETYTPRYIHRVQAIGRTDTCIHTTYQHKPTHKYHTHTHIH